MIGDWLEHRIEKLGMRYRWQLADAADLPDEIIYDIFEVGTFADTNRSERYRLAKALLVTVRQLERLDEGLIDWIPDTSVTYYNQPRCWTDPLGEDPKPLKTKKKGIPVLGRLRRDGRIDIDEWWDEEYGRRLDIYYPTVPRAYAFEREDSDQCVVLRDTAPFEIATGAKMAVYVSDGFEGQGYYAQVFRTNGPTLWLDTGNGDRKPVNLEDVMRAGKLMLRYPESSDDVAKIGGASYARVEGEN